MIHFALLLSVGMLPAEITTGCEASHVLALAPFAPQGQVDPSPSPEPQPEPDSGVPGGSGEVQGRASEWAESIMRKVVSVTLDEAIKKTGGTQEDVGGIWKTVRRFNKAMDAFSDPAIRAAMAEGEPTAEDAIKRYPNRCLVFTATWCPPCMKRVKPVLGELEKLGWTQSDKTEGFCHIQIVDITDGLPPEFNHVVNAIRGKDKNWAVPVFVIVNPDGLVMQSKLIGGFTAMKQDARTGQMVKVDNFNATSVSAWLHDALQDQIATK